MRFGCNEKKIALYILYLFFSNLQLSLKTKTGIEIFTKKKLDFGAYFLKSLSIFAKIEITT